MQMCQLHFQSLLWSDHLCTGVPTLGSHSCSSHGTRRWSCDDDVVECHDGASNDRHLAVVHQLQQQAPQLQELVRVDCVDLGHALRGGLPDIGLRVTGCCAHRDHDQLNDLQDLDGSHSPQCRGAHQLTAVREVLLKAVDGEQGKVAIVLRILHQVDVDELLQLQGLKGDVLHDIRKEHRAVAADGYCRKDPLHGVDLALCQAVAEGFTELGLREPLLLEVPRLGAAKGRNEVAHARRSLLHHRRGC
mmetsp:Transcript_139299/g.445375  ORF Transcript_139299/g.445375 Transcript_139299/m.445375 type:complete len:247 (-) Transcript_139299:98-838(-)